MSTVYVHNAVTGHNNELCDLGKDDIVSSVRYNHDGTRIAVGSFLGTLRVFDTERCQEILCLNDHDCHVGVCEWGPEGLSNGQMLASGSHDGRIFKYDLRERRDKGEKLEGHKEEVCGLAWEPHGKYLASGGNDNKVLLWSSGSFTRPVKTMSAHKAAVKALAWSPRKHGLLASGGGSRDNSIRFWNTSTGELDSVHDAGSQVCALAFSRHTNQLVSSHGYSKCCAYVWNLEDMSKDAVLLGQPSRKEEQNEPLPRMLNMAISPEGTQVVTSAEDEKLRFWNVLKKSAVSCTRSPLLLNGMDLR